MGEVGLMSLALRQTAAGSRCGHLLTSAARPYRAAARVEEAKDDGMLEEFMRAQ